MNNSKFKESKLIYDLTTNFPELFQNRPEDLMSKLEQLKQGLPLENEFIALCLWMGKSVLIHKLDQKQMPRISKDKYQIPDLFLIFEYEGRQIPFLIEIKTTREPKFVLSQKYHNKIKNYSNLMGLPLLFAWKIKKIGAWFLLDIDLFKQKQQAYHVSFEEAFKNNLLCLLVGDYSIHLRKNIKFIIRLKKEELLKEKIKGPEISQFWKTRIVGANFINYKGEKISKVPRLLFHLLVLARIEDRTEDQGDYLTQIFEVPESSFLFASNLLGLALIGDLTKYNPKTIDWDKLIHNEAFRISFAQVKQAVKESMAKGFIQFLGNVLPHVKPKALVSL